MSHPKLPALKFKALFLVLVSMVFTSAYAQASLTQNDVSQLYVAIFNRASEGGGNAWWQANYNDRIIAANAMLQSEVAQEYFGDALNTDLDFIKHIYKNTLNKTYEDDPGGINYWVGELGKGKSRGEVVAAMVGVIKEYAPGGLYYTNDPATIAAYNQFTNRVTISNYMADTLLNPPANWQTATQFGPGGLNVTFEAATVNMAKQAINIFAGSPAGLEDDIEYYMAMITSAGELSPMMDEISVLLGTILSGDSSVVTITPPLDSIDPYYPPSTINITANFGSGYTPEGSTSVYTGTTVINITNISFAGTNLTANAALTATDVRRDGELVLNGNMTFGINVGMAGGNTSVNATAGFTNLSSMDALINGNIALSIPAINDNGQLTQPAILTLNQFTTMDYQMNGTVTMTQPSAEIFDVNFNLTTNEGPVTGILRAQTQTDPVEMELMQTILSTPSGPMTVGDASVTISQVVMDPDVCEDLPASGNILITRGAESATISFSSCAYTVN